MQAPAGEGDFDERPLGHCFAVGLPPNVWVLVDDVARTVATGGGICIDSIYSVGVALGFDPHGSANAADCHDLRGVGFAFLGLAAVVVIAVGRMRLATKKLRDALGGESDDQKKV